MAKSSFLNKLLNRTVSNEGLLDSLVKLKNKVLGKPEEPHYYNSDKLTNEDRMTDIVLGSMIFGGRGASQPVKVVVSKEEVNKEEESEDGSNDDTGDTDDQSSDDTESSGTEDDGISDDTETDDKSTSDETSEETEEEKDTEIIEPEKKEVEPPTEIEQPDENKQAIKTYLEPLLGDQINQLTLFSAGEVNRPLYHVSMNPRIQRFVPQVSNRTVSKENRSVPRISTSTSLIGCMNGYQSMVSDMQGRATKNFNGIFKVYELPYQYAVKPSPQLLVDVEYTDEYWLVSWKKETYITVPNTVAEFTIPKIETIYIQNGTSHIFHMYVKVMRNSLYLDHEKKLEPGCYYVELVDYSFKYPLDHNENIRIIEIPEDEYRKVTSLSMMIKKH